MSTSNCKQEKQKDKLFARYFHVQINPSPRGEYILGCVENINKLLFDMPVFYFYGKW